MDKDLVDSHSVRVCKDLVYRLNHSADLVKKFGDYRFTNGLTIGEILTIDEVSYWDLITAELAHFHLPQVFLSKKGYVSFFDTIKPILLRFKYSLSRARKKKIAKNDLKNLNNSSYIAFLGFSNRMYIDILYPLIVDLDESVTAVVLTDGPLLSRSEFSVESCEYQSLWNFSTKNTDLSVRNTRRILKSRIRNVEIEELLRQVLNEEDLDYLPNFLLLFRRVFDVYLPVLIDYVVLGRCFVQARRPLMVVSPDTADSRTRVFSILSRRFGIPILDIQFGLSGEEAVEYRFLLSDILAVWGSSSKKAILKQGVEDFRVVVTGSPRHDMLVNRGSTDLSILRNSLGIPSDFKVVLLASTYNFKDKTHVDVSILEDMQRSISEAVTLTKDVFLIIKPHPHENVFETKTWFSNSDRIVFVEKDADIKKYILLCDAFISYGSTSTIDALIAGKFIVCPIFPGWTFSSDMFRNSGATLTPCSRDEVLRAIQAVSDGTYLEFQYKVERHRQNFLNDLVFEMDGQSTRRVLDLVSSMILRNKQQTFIN
jgi:hypothetical protein